MSISSDKAPRSQWGPEFEEVLSHPILSVEGLPAPLRTKRHLAQFLDRLESSGRLRRIRRGAYVVVRPGPDGAPVLTDPFVIASVVGSPYGISFYSALEIRGLVESASRRVYIQTPSRFTPFSFDGTEYVPVVTRHLFGMEVVYRSGVALQVTDVERTILDCLRMPAYAGGLDEFLRALEGIQRTDLLAVVLDQVTASGAFPDLRKFRATFEDRRAEFDQLLRAGLLGTLGERPFYLTVLGLSFCPHPAAAAELDNARKVFAYLRQGYKTDPDRRHRCDEAAPKLGMDPAAFKRAVAALSLSDLGIFGWVMEQGSFAKEAAANESVLDHVDLDQALAVRLQRFKPPADLRLRKSTIVSVRFDRLLQHLESFGEQALYAKAGFLLRFFQDRWKPLSEVFDQLAKHVGGKKTYFPARQPRGAGRLIREWNLIVPLHLHSRYVAASGSTSGERRASV